MSMPDRRNSLCKGKDDQNSQDDHFHGHVARAVIQDPHTQKGTTLCSI